MTRSGVALGSNIADRLRHLTMARMMIGELTRSVLPMHASAVYETEPVDCEPGAGNFLNAVLEIGWDGEAASLHRALRQIENELGRAARHPRNASRTIDLDLLYFGDAVTSRAELELPHPRLEKRRFVLQPLADICPELVLPRQTQTVAELLAGLADTSHVVRADSQW